MVRSITDTLRHLEAGCLIDEASELLAELVKAVDTTGFMLLYGNAGL